LNNKPYPTRHMPQLSIDIGAIFARLRNLVSVCEDGQSPINSAISDIASLLIEVNRLYLALEKERVRSANLEAAIRAALSAHHDGETDPLSYLRDELPDTDRGWCP
jgi:hypothetical protein